MTMSKYNFHSSVSITTDTQRSDFVFCFFFVTNADRYCNTSISQQVQNITKLSAKALILFEEYVLVATFKIQVS